MIYPVAADEDPDLTARMVWSGEPSLFGLRWEPSESFRSWLAAEDPLRGEGWVQ